MNKFQITRKFIKGFIHDKKFRNEFIGITRKFIEGLFMKEMS